MGNKLGTHQDLGQRTQPAWHQPPPRCPPWFSHWQPQLPWRKELERKCFGKEPLFVCFLIQGEAGSFESNGLTSQRICRMSFAWLKARCLHTAKPGSHSRRGRKKIYQNTQEEEKKNSWFSGALELPPPNSPYPSPPPLLYSPQSIAFIIYLFIYFHIERNVISPHKMDQAFSTSNNNLTTPIQLKYFTTQSLCERVNEWVRTGRRVKRLLVWIIGIL